jgi:hypothetical protein
MKYYVIGVLQQDDDQIHVNEVVDSTRDRVMDVALETGARKVGKRWRDWDHDPERDNYNYWLLAIVELSPGLPVVYTGADFYYVDDIIDDLEGDVDTSLPLWVGAGQDEGGETYVFRMRAESPEDFAEELRMYARRTRRYDEFEAPFGLVREDGGDRYTVFGPEGLATHVSAHAWGILRPNPIKQLKRQLLAR